MTSMMSMIHLCRTRFSWIIHIFMFIVLGTVYVVEVVRFDTVFELKVIVLSREEREFHIQHIRLFNLILSFRYLQLLLLFGVASIGIAGRFHKEIQDRYEFYKWVV